MTTPAPDLPALPTSEAAIVLKERQPLFENTVFSAFLDHIGDARGNEVAHYLSVIPRHCTADGISGVAILPEASGRFGLLHVFRHPLQRWSWEIPKGFIDADESSWQAALRELAEETGYRLAADRLRLAGTIAPEAGVIKARVQIFVATLGDHAALAPASGKELGHDGMRFFHPDEIGGLIASGDLEDACTLSAFYLHALHGGEKAA